MFFAMVTEIALMDLMKRNQNVVSVLVTSFNVLATINAFREKITAMELPIAPTNPTKRVRVLKVVSF